MIRTRETDGVRFLSCFEQSGGVRAFFSTRVGGVSEKPFDSLNLGRNTDDDPNRVAENRRRFFRAVGVDEAQTAFQRQVHEDRIRYVEEVETCDQTDALFTDVPGLYLAVTVADCVPILLYWPDRRVVGVVHAGWKGTARRIAQKSVEAIRHRHDGDPSTMVALIGPSISGRHYEVSEEVASQFEPAAIIRNGTARPHLDLWQANALQLKAAGVLHITIAGLCTYAEDGLFYSHRKSGGQTGRMLGIIGLTE